MRTIFSSNWNGKSDRPAATWFYTVLAEALDFRNTITAARPCGLCLTDFELLDESERGLDIIDKSTNAPGPEMSQKLRHLYLVWPIYFMVYLVWSTGSGKVVTSCSMEKLGDEWDFYISICSNAICHLLQSALLRICTGITPDLNMIRSRLNLLHHLHQNPLLLKPSLLPSVTQQKPLAKYGNSNIPEPPSRTQVPTCILMPVSLPQ